MKKQYKKQTDLLSEAVKLLKLYREDLHNGTLPAGKYLDERKSDVDAIIFIAEHIYVVRIPRHE